MTIFLQPSQALPSILLCKYINVGAFFRSYSPRNNTSRQSRMEEPMLVANPDRFVLLPIQHIDIYKMYKDLVSVRWIVEEVDMSKDKVEFEALKEGERHFIKCILGFFAGSDGIVCENLAMNFCNEIQVPEAKAFYCEQLSNETVHNETYSRLVDTYFPDRAEKQTVLQAINTMPFVAKKADWAIKWMSREASFASRLMAFAIVEGVFFSGAFCAIYYFKERNALKGLTLANEFISRDEGLHTDFACLIYSKLKTKLSHGEAHELMKEAVEIEKEFITEALPCSLIGMNAKLMKQYIQYVADRLLVQLGYKKLYNNLNPFSFMERISLEGKDNFFEKRVSTYALANCGKSPAEMTFSLEAEF
jgi:ribonucleoside-diphosphate reductase beta chain